jgi:hydrogenase nickel incorporation protein HypA/HybF
MHEMSIITSILDIAEKEARAADARVINSIELEVGELAGIEVDSLMFCFEAARRQTLAADGELVIRSVPGRGRCLRCEKEVPMEGFAVATCPDCDIFVDVYQGRELRVLSINVD